SVDAPRKRDGDAVTEGRTEAGHEGHREGMKRGPREVPERLAFREEVAGVLDHEGVRELDAEAASERLGPAIEPIDELDGLLVARVGGEGRVRHVIGVTEDAVQDAARLLLAEQGRVQLDHTIEADLLEEVRGDALDLVGRAAVEGRERQ